MGDEPASALRFLEPRLAGASHCGNYGRRNAAMKGMLRRILTLGVCVLAFAATSATAAFAEDGDDPELEDVSKQVGDIEEKLDELLARGRWARAGKLLAAADCTFGEASAAFAPWGDDATYSLAPQGDLAATDEWTLDKDATIVPGADPFSGAAQSLELAKGADAASPAMCVNLDHPTIRFFIKGKGGNEKSRLKVDVLYEDFGGHVKQLTIARLKARSEWRPSVIIPMYMNRLALASPAGLTAVAFRFRAVGLQKDETLSISSLCVDPFRNR
jgi:hypothetical protein